MACSTPSDITYRPLEVLEGRLEVDGRELAPVNPDEVRRVVRRMLETAAGRRVRRFGLCERREPVARVAGQGDHPRGVAGVSVTCAHEVSDKPNYRVRSVTAALNASIIPCLESFLDAVDAALHQRGIDCPRMVVKSDGSLMNLPVARRRPIETILSGPAASVAGASYLANLPDAMVVDMGGTTTDTAIIRGGQVRTCQEGASVGGWRTHVGALDLRTVGLGGDSLIARRQGTANFRSVPLRVAPVAWTFSNGCGRGEGARLVDGPSRSLPDLDLRHGIACQDGGGVPATDLHEPERRLLDLLAVVRDAWTKWPNNWKPSTGSFCRLSGSNSGIWSSEPR